jgi:hypothetical protein
MKEWAFKKHKALKSFLNVDTSIDWITNSVYEVSLNLLEKIDHMFAADITKCYANQFH